MFNGVMTDLITPMSEGDLDLESLADIVNGQCEAGCHGLVAGSRTGEATSLTLPELVAVVQRCLDIAGKRIPVIAGVGTGDLPATFAQIEALRPLGPDALLLMLPAIQGATPTGLSDYVRLIHDETDGPLLIDHDPARTGHEIDIETILQILDLPHIIGLRDASTDLTRVTLIRARMNKGAALLTGCDTTAAAYLAHGGHGCISVTANCAPHLCARLQDAWRNEDIDAFETARDALAPLNAALTLESAPIAVKYALQRMGRCSDDVRLPLLPAMAQTREIVDKTLAMMGANAASSAELAA